MAALKNERDTIQIAQDAARITVPVKGNTTIYQGALVALDAGGFAVPGQKATGLTAVGRAEETVNNTGADGDIAIQVQRGVFIYDNSATGKVTQALVLKPCYMADDQTVTATATGASVAGLVIAADTETVTVQIGTGLTVASGG